MRYSQLTDQNVATMLDTLGVDSIASLFETVPDRIRLRGDLGIPQGLSELELLRDMQSLASRNRNCEELVCFLGGGAYDHFIPTVVDAMAGKGEFLTAYTPYQAEASQGILQLFYEFQTMIARLMGMDVANASLYEGASAVMEAVIMATGLTRRRRAIVAESVHPDTLRVLRTYAHQQDLDIVAIPSPNGVVDEQALLREMNGDTAAVVLQSPNFYGCLERMDRIIPRVHEHGALAIVSTDPVSCGLLKPPGAFDADIVVGEGQVLGVPLQYGGPYLGLLACREKYLRKMPGRVVGMAKDKNGRRGFCLTLQTREQHIKRERATSNICTNQGLLAIRAAVYLAAMGPRGIADVATHCFDKAHYAAGEIAKLEGYTLRFDAPFFKEFVVRCARGADSAVSACRDRSILGGVPLERFGDRFDDCLLIAVTEKRTKKEIDDLVSALRSA